MPLAPSEVCSLPNTSAESLNRWVVTILMTRKSEWTLKYQININIPWLDFFQSCEHAKSWAGQVVSGASGPSCERAKPCAGPSCERAKLWAGQVVSGAKLWAGQVVSGPSRERAKLWAGQVVSGAESWAGPRRERTKSWAGPSREQAKLWADQIVSGPSCYLDTDGYCCSTNASTSSEAGTVWELMPSSRLTAVFRTL